MLDAARQRLFDSLASFVVGAAAPEGQLMRRLSPLPPRRERARVRVSGAEADLIRYACAATRCTELDDIHIPSCTTAGSIVVPVALLTAAAQQSDDGDLLCGLVAGYEAMTRLGCAINGATVLYKGVWPTYFAAPFAAAATVARLLNLDRERAAHALAIATARSSGVTARTSGTSSSRWFAAGCAAADGYLAARAAALGMTGDGNVLEQALPRATAVELDLQAFEGDRWLIMDVDTKPFSTSRQALSSVEAYLRIVDARPMGGIASIRAWVPGQVRSMVENPQFPLGVPYLLATATYDRLSLWDVTGSRPPVRPLDNVEVLDDERLTGLFPAQWGGRVEVRWEDGVTAIEEVLDPRGSARNPFGWDELLDKHRRVASATDLPDSWIEPVYQLCRGFAAQSGSRAGELAHVILSEAKDLPPRRPSEEVPSSPTAPQDDI